jgi:formate/nitrite transporter
MTVSVDTDFYPPHTMAGKAVLIGIKKANLSGGKMFSLAVLAGLFVATGAYFSTTVTSGWKDLLPFGIMRLVSGLTFATALIMVLVAGSELFTGNMLMVMAFLEKKISLWQMVRNWMIVYLGNLTGSVLMAALILLGKHYSLGKGVVGLNILTIAESKTSLGFVQALVLGILCNFLVCLAVWMTYSARTTTDKILAIIPPITAFVAAGFEHSVANMYFIPVGLLVKQFGGDTFFEAIGKTAADFPHLTLWNFLMANLLPVTLGNMIGGILLVGAIYWFIYLRRE